MNLSIEGLDARIPIQKINSSPPRENRLRYNGNIPDLSSQGIISPSEGDELYGTEIYHRVLAGEIPGLREERAQSSRNRWKMGTVGLISAALLAACAPQASRGEHEVNSPIAANQAPIPAEQITPSPTNTPEATPTVTPTPKPEVKIEPFDCKILSPEACATGEVIQFNVYLGQTRIGIAFNLSPGEKLILPKTLSVSQSELKQPHIYQGSLISAKNDQNTETYGYYGNIELSKQNGKLPGGTILGKIGEEDIKVFEGQPYNFLSILPPTELSQFTEHYKKPIKIINNKVPDQLPGVTSTFYDITPVPGKG